MIDFMVLRTPFRTLRLSLRRLLRGIRVRVVPKAAGVDASVLGCLSVLDSEVSDMAGAVSAARKGGRGICIPVELLSVRMAVALASVARALARVARALARVARA